MKYILIALIALFGLLQYEIWFSQGGLFTVYKLKRSIARQTAENQRLKQRNETLIADIKDLKHGKQAIEERARNDLGMIKKGEVFYRVVN